MKRGHVAPSKRLNFDTMELIPVKPTLMSGVERWHVPGRFSMTTQELISLATRRGLNVSITENAGDGTSSTTALN